MSTLTKTIVANSSLYSLKYPNLQMFRLDSPSTEVGTEVNPIDFGFCPAGQDTQLSYDILLYNDKGDVVHSDDAKDLSIQLIQMDVIESHVSTGVADQSYTVAYTPLSSVEVYVNGSKWALVQDFLGYGQYANVFTCNLTTGVLTFGNGVQGAIPPVSQTILIDYIPILNIFGKAVYYDKWVSIRSIGVIEAELTVLLEIAEKIDNSTVQVVHRPKITEITGVWDNPGKTGTNYFTGGSFNEDTGIVTLGTPFTGVIPYTDYKYTIQDDDEGGFTLMGYDLGHIFSNPIPRNNAKVLQLKVTVPATASTEGGVYLKVRLQINYNY